MEQHTRKKILGGYPAVGVVISTTLALFVFGLFGNLLIYSQQLGAIVRDNLNVKIYLKNSVTEAQRNQLQTTILTRDFVAKTESPIRFVSKEEAQEDLVAQIGDYKEILGENPLKDALVIKIAPEKQDSTSLRGIKKDLASLSGVLEVTYEKHLFDEVNQNIKNVSLYLLIISALLILTTFILVNNTLKLALFSQRFLIRSMQLVGAKQFFIISPFLLRAFGYGLLSAVLAGGIMWSLSDYAQHRIPEITVLHNAEYFLILIGALVTTGILISCVSTYFAIRKYLKMSLDDLY